MLVGNYCFRLKTCYLHEVAVTVPKKKKSFQKPFSIYYFSKRQQTSDVSSLVVFILKPVVENQNDSYNNLILYFALGIIV